MLWSILILNGSMKNRVGNALIALVFTVQKNYTEHTETTENKGICTFGLPYFLP